MRLFRIVAISMVALSFAVGALAQQREGVEAEQTAAQRVVSPDGKLALTRDGNTLKVRDVVTGYLIRTLHMPSGIASFSFAPDGSHIVVVGHDNRSRLWNIITGRLVNEK
jgi:WD40 repeat protein